MIISRSKYHQSNDRPNLNIRKRHEPDSSYHRRTGRGAGGSCPPPPIRAVCRHTFGQRVDIIRAKHNTCLNNTNLGYVTAVNGNNSRTTPPPHRIVRGKYFCYYPPPPHTEYGSRKIFGYYPLPTEPFRAKLGLPPPPQLFYYVSNISLGLTFSFETLNLNKSI